MLSNRLFKINKLAAFLIELRVDRRTGDESILDGMCLALFDLVRAHGCSISA